MNTTWRKKTLIISMAFYALISPLLTRGQQESQRHEGIPRIQMDEVPLSYAIQNCARQIGFNYILDPRVPSDASVPPVTFTLENVTVEDALDRLLRLRGLVRIENPVTSVTRIAPAKLGIKPVSREQFGNDTNAVVRVVLFDDVPLKDAVQSLADQLRIKITFDEKSIAKRGGESILLAEISIRWKDLTVKQALVALLDNYDLVMIEGPSGSTAQITTKEKAPKPNSP